MERLRISREFFGRDTATVARDLLGKYIVRKTPSEDLIVKVMEVEAYLGPRDKACHSYNYRETERTKTMYLEPGFLYVYLIYGMYHCLNVITEPKGIPCAVLIRKAYPVQGIEIMKENRKTRIGKNFKNLLDGPGKLCMALNITKDIFNGMDACDLHTNLYFIEGERVNSDEIMVGRRIGIDYAEEDKEKLLRFYL
jgi:DNA-3-methyladenine glycosylase